MRLIDADALIEKLLRTADIEWNQNTGTTWAMAYEEVAETVDDQPTINPAKNKLQRALDGKTEEETYDFLHWLMFEYAKQYTDSRSGVIKWLREDSAERGER